MIRAVYDTNVVVSGLLWVGAPAQAIDLALDGQITLLASEALLHELTTVLTRPKFGPRFKRLGKSPEDFLVNYRALVEIVEPTPIQSIITADPSDDAVLACAATGKADYIVSGDKHLLTLAMFEKIPVVTINEFFARLSLQDQ